MPGLQCLARLRLTLIAWALVTLAWTQPAAAAQLQVLVDLDLVATTGCTVATPAGPFTGVEQRFITTINTAVDPPLVTGVTREICVDPATSTFGAPTSVSGGGWPVGVGLGVGGSNAIETGMLLPPGTLSARVGFVYLDPATGNATLLAAVGGGPIVISAVTAGNPSIPTLSHAMLLLLVALVGAAAFVPLRRKGYPAAPLAVLVLVLATTMAWAAIVLDGAMTDWSGIPPAASSPSGTAYATFEGSSLFARMDVTTGMPPRATNDTYTATAATTLTIPAGSGLLANDTLGVPAATIASYGGGSLGGAVTDHAGGAAATFGVGGSLTVNADGSVSFTPATGFTGAFTFSYRLANPNATSDGTVTLGVDQAPAITSANLATFTIGNAGTFTVTATGFPAPTLSLTGALPSGIAFNAGTGVLAGTPAAGTAGTYPLTITAANGVGANATQAFTLTVNQRTSITSANATTFTVGTTGTFTVTTTGSPVAGTLSFTGTLPTGVSFNNNGDGTATLAGIPGTGTGGAYAITISATNGVGAPATQPFTLTVREAPQITTTNAITLTRGIASPFTIIATGFPAPAITETGPLPAGITFTDNGNGTATLAGTATTGGTFPIALQAANGVTPNATQAFTITVDQGAAFTSAAATTFTAGSAGSFPITTSGIPVATSIGETGALPGVVTFTNNGNGTATLAGIPNAGSGGTYVLALSASNGVGGPAAQSFTLTVDEAPQITSIGNTAFAVGSAGTFTVATLGFPIPALSGTGALPAGVSFVDNGNGSATIAGVPGVGSGGIYTLTLGAANGIGAAAAQSFTLTVLEAPAANTDSYTTVHDTPLTVAAPGVLANDTGSPPPALTSVTGLGPVTCSAFPCSIPAQHGNATVNVDGSFTYTPNANFAGADFFDYTIGNSSGAAGSLATFTVTNALPVVDLNGPAAGTGFGPVTWTEGAGAVAIVDPAQLTVTDADGAQLASATVQIAPLSDPGSEVLAVACPDAPPGCSGAIQRSDVAYDPSLGTLAIVRAAPLADYQALLRTLTYDSTTQNPTGPSRTVSVVANDGIADGAPADATVTVAAQDNAPTVTAPATALAATDATLAFAGNVSVADVDGNAANEKVTLTVTNGTASLSGTAGLTVTGNGTALVVATGPLTSLNGALNGMSFTSSSGFTGAATLRIDIDDLGNTGAGGPKTANRTIAISVDARPTITTTIPVNGAASISTANTLTVNFSEPVNVTTSSFAIECPVGSARPYALSASPSASIVLTPLSALPAGTACRVTVVAAQVTDSVGLNPTANFVFTFTTNTLPTVTSTVPANGATAVAANSTVTFSFSESVNATAGSFTLECPSGSARAFALSASPSASFVLTPTLALPSGTSCVATALAAAITDADAGQGLGANATTTFTTTSPPTITSANAATFAVGAAGTFSVTTTGSPSGASMAISQTGALPTGVGFVNNANGTATLAGTPGAGTGGNYPITITASNGVTPDATQSFTLTVNQAPAITSANSVTFQKNVAGTTFTVTTTGFPAPATITESGALPAGVNFANNGSGTATISGTPTVSGVFPITITANNGVTPNATQSFTITVNEAPAITSANSTTFFPNNAGTFTITTTGTPTVTSITETGALPTGLAFSYTSGSTATISGTTAAVGSYPLTIGASNAISPNASQAFTLNVSCPVITVSPTTLANGTVNSTYGPVAFGASGGSGSYTFAVSAGAAPPGLAFAGASFGGTPTDTGAFSFTVTATDTVTGCTGVQSFSNVIIDLTASNDDYGNIVGNVLVDSQTAGGFSVVANDQVPVGTTITAFDATSANSGTVTMVTSGGALGHFTYNPPHGFLGVDSFTYTVSKNGRSATGTVTFNITATAWFINNAGGACSASCDGRLTNPYTTLANFNTANTGATGAPQNGDPIFVYTGTAAYTGSTTLRQSQKLVGQGATSSFAALGGLTAGAGQTLPNTGGTSPNVNAAVTLTAGNTLAGFDMDGANPSLSATSVTGITVNLGRFRRTGTSSNAIQLAGAGNSGSYAFKSVTLTGTTGSANRGVSIQNFAGTFTVSGTDAGVSPNGGTISGYGGNGMDFRTVSQCGIVGTCGTAAVSLSNMALSGDALSQTVAGNDASCGGAITTGNNTACLANLYLQDVDGVSLTSTSITNSAQMGVNGNNVYRYVQNGGNITGNGNEADEGGILFQNLHGASSITSATIRDNHASQMVVGMMNAGSSALTLTVTGTSFSNTSTNADRTSGLVLTGAAGGTTTLNVSGSSFANNGTGFGVDITAGTTTAPLNLSGQVTTSSFTTSVGGVSVLAQSSSAASFNTVNNPSFTLMSVEAIAYETAPTATGSLLGRITGNTIGTNGVPQSACSVNNCAGISVVHNGGGTNTNSSALQVTISGNTLQQIWNGFGITLSGNGAGSMQASVASNTLRQPAGDDSNQAEAIDVNFATLSGSTITSCMNVTGNAITSAGGSTTWGAGLFLDDIHTRARNGEQIRLPGYAGASTDTTAVQNFISGNNAGAVVFSETAGGGSYTGGAACTTP